jgi:mannitol/fructose-specific phosphotransferase system IIA component (Ntr-type)
MPIPNQPEPVELIFFLLSPIGDTEGHLATLNDIARNCRSTHKRTQLLKAKNIDAVIDAIVV